MAKKYIEYIYTFDFIPEYKIGINGFIERIKSHPMIDLWTITHKDFEWWNFEKQMIDSSNKKIYAHPREMRWIKMWINIWTEQNGKGWYMRPFLIIKKVWSLYFGIPTTTASIKKHFQFYHTITSFDFGSDEQSVPICSSCILNQVKVIDSKRFIKKIGLISEEEYMYIKEKLQRLLFETS